mmetsp:Transcript_109564/g.353617  ORF Transcript_109564/g.353617 Transcript_109564/m.353617 type:complete len:231 (-) Transcript_109564:1462-2154(-)
MPRLTAQPARGLDAVEVIVDVLLERLGVLREALLGRIAILHELVLLDARDRQLLGHLMQALHELPLARACGRVRPELAQEVVDLRDHLVGDQVGTGPLLRELEVGVQHREEAGADGQDEQEGVQRALGLGPGDGELELLAQEQRRDVVGDLLVARLLQGQGDRGHGQKRGQEHGQGDGKDEAQGQAPEVLRLPRELAVQPPALEDHGALALCGALLPGVAVVAVQHRRDL